MNIITHRKIETLRPWPILETRMTSFSVFSAPIREKSAMSNANNMTPASVHTTAS